MNESLKRIIKDFHNNDLPKVIKRQVDIPINLEKVITVIGPRRAGKTYCLYQLISTLLQNGVLKDKIVYINFEDERLNFTNNYDSILEAYLQLYPEQNLNDVYFFFDEIQELSNWEKFIRRIYDNISKKIFLTGSNAKMLSKEIATSLRGRSISFEIMPLSFEEYLNFGNISVEDRFSLKNSSLIKKHYNCYLEWGGYPELVKVEPRYKVKILQEYFQVMLYRDLVERYKINDLSQVKYFIKRLIGSFTKEFSINKLYNDLKSRGISTSKDNLYKTVEQIFSVYLLANVEKYDPSVTRREMSNKKVYLFDNGLISANQFISNQDRGKLLENMIFNHLRRETEDIFFSKNRWECDFLAFYPLKVKAIQVTQKLSKANLKREIKGLESAKKIVPKAQCLIIVEDKSLNIQIPDWIETINVLDWLLD